MNTLRTMLLTGLFASVAAGGVAAEDAGTRMLDPWVPPSLRKASPRPPSEGVELKAQVERKLRESFDAADVGGTGAVTRDQAQAAGLGFVAKNFERIDTAGTGRVTLDDVKRFLRARGAAL